MRKLMRTTIGLAGIGPAGTVGWFDVERDTEREWVKAEFLIPVEGRESDRQEIGGDGSGQPGALVQGDDPGTGDGEGAGTVRANHGVSEAAAAGDTGGTERQGSQTGVSPYPGMWR